MGKRKLQAGLVFLAAVLLLFIAAGTARRSHVFEVGMELGIGLGQEISDAARDAFYEYVKALDDRVTVTRSAQGESFFEEVYARIGELEREYPGARILCTVEMTTFLDGAVAVEIEEYPVHYLYMGTGDVFYECQGDMSIEMWRTYLGEVLFRPVVTEDGRRAAEGDFDFKVEFSGKPTEENNLYFGGIQVRLYEAKSVLSFGGTHGEDGSEEFYLRYVEAEDFGREQIHVVTIRTAAGLPEHGTTGEMRDHFLDRYPDMVCYRAYPAEEKEDDTYFYLAEETGAAHAYFSYRGHRYEVTDEIEGAGPLEEDSHNWEMTQRIRRQLDYDYREAYLWENGADGLFWADYEKREFHLEQDIGNGTQLVFQVSKAPGEDDGERDLFYTDDLKVEVYRAGDMGPFQTFMVSSAERNPFSFEDFNADGYLDLTAVEFYGANGGTASHHLWSPSQECFVRAPEFLDYYGSYGVNEELRRLYMHWHGSAVSGTDFLYQWENETDCVLLRYMDYAYREGGGIKIVRGEGADEEVLLDYVLASEGGQTGTGLFWYDIVWEKEVSYRSTGRRYHMYYAQEQQYDEHGEANGIYGSYLYVVDDELSLYNYRKWEGQSPYTELSWNAPGSEEELIIRYEDGTETVYGAQELLQERGADVASYGGGD